MKKRIVAVILTAAVLVLTMAGFSSAAEIPLDGTWPEEPVKIAMEIYDTTDSAMLADIAYVDYLSQFFNIELFVSESIGSPEQEHEFVSNCAAAGCKVYYAAYNTTSDALVDAVTEYGMYYISPERIYDEKYADNPYYLGGYNVVTGGEQLGNGWFMIGYEIARSLAKSECKHAAYCNGAASFGVELFKDIQEGFFAGIDAARKDGYEIAFDPAVDVIEGFPGTDEFASRMSQVLSGDYDGIGISFSAMEVWIQPIIDAGKAGQVKIAGLGNISDSMIGVAEMGMLAGLVYQCEEFSFGNMIPIALNAVTGHSDFIKGDEGCLSLDAELWLIDNEEDLKEIYEKHQAGEYYMTGEDVASLLVELNPELTREDFIEYFKSKSLENCLAR